MESAIEPFRGDANRVRPAEWVTAESCWLLGIRSALECVPGRAAANGDNRRPLVDQQAIHDRVMPSAGVRRGWGRRPYAMTFELPRLRRGRSELLLEALSAGRLSSRRGLRGRGRGPSTRTMAQIELTRPTVVYRRGRRHHRALEVGGGEVVSRLAGVFRQRNALRFTVVGFPS